MIIFLFGKEKYLIQQRLKRLKEVFLERNEKAMVKEIDLEEDFDWLALESSLNEGSGLFAEKKMVIWKNVLSLDIAKQGKLKNQLQDFEKNDNQATILIIVELHSKESRSQLFTYLKKREKAEHYEILKGEKLSQWIKQKVAELSEQKVTISDRAIEKLARINRHDLWQLSQALQQMVSFKLQGVLDLAEVDYFCQGEAEAKIFDLVDAVGNGNKGRALKLKKQLIDQGENEFYIFTMILFQIKNLIKVSLSVKQKNKTAREISQRLKMHPFVIQKTLGQLKNFSLKKLKKIYALATKLDLKTKTGEATMDQVLDYFIIKIGTI